MKLINAVKQTPKFVLVASACAVLPLLMSSAFAEKKSHEKRVQAAGYIGKLSKEAIASGMLQRLESAETLADINLDTGDTALDLKNRIGFWHNVALDTVALDHTPAGEDGAPVNQGGPTRTSRALAIVQISVFDAINAIDEEYNNFSDFNYTESNAGASEDSAVATAAYVALTALYPDHAARLDAIYAEDLALINSNQRANSVTEGVRLGTLAANAVIDARSSDNSDVDEPSFGQGGLVADGATTFFGTPVNGGTAEIGEWQPDPNTPDYSGDYNLSLGAFWGAVTPFFLQSGDQFRADAPPLPGDRAYRTAYNEVAHLGGALDNENTESTATDETSFIGNFWGYDGVPLIGVPPRVYNQISSQIAGARIDDSVEYARFLALINIGMADAAIASWDSKFYYNFWRPVTGIRTDDGARGTTTDASWNPIGVSVINTEETIRPTPPFPAYPSGHATFGATVFNIMTEFFGNNTAFTFVSDEFNGEGVDPFFPDVPRPLVPVRFDSFSDAQEENGRSRVYNGVHWNFDDTAGQEMGEQIADYLLNDIDAFQLADNNNGGGGNGGGGNGGGGNGGGGNGGGGNGGGGNGGGGNGGGGNGGGGNGGGGNGGGGNGGGRNGGGR